MGLNVSEWENQFPSSCAASLSANRLAATCAVEVKVDSHWFLF